MTPRTRAALVKTLGRAVGFDRVGVTCAGPVQHAAYYRDWLAAGHGGTMEYLRRHATLRADPALLLPGARSVICVALNYRRAPVVAPGGGRPAGRVAAYAQGRDYHAVLRQTLGELVDRLRERLREPFETRVCVDTAPVLERALAQAAGLGWIGRNTCLMHESLGSYLFLGEVVTTLELTPDQPATDHCGSCTRCLDACPTQALIAPHRLDATRCISYLTIEHRGEVPDELGASIGNRVFGCDVCQEACPHNRAAPPATHPEIAAEHTPAFVDLLDLLRLRSGEYRRLTKGSASARARRSMWRRNAAIALGNLEPDGPGVPDEIEPALAEVARDDDPLVRQAAERSLARLKQRTR